MNYNRIHFFCKECGIQCRTQIEYDNHLQTTKHKKNTNQLDPTQVVTQKEEPEFHCEKCDYRTKHKQNFQKHCSSKKHEENMSKE